MPIKHNSTVMYVLIDPRDQSVRYVGQTTNPHLRLGQHMAAARSGFKLSRRDQWIMELLDRKMKPVMQILREVSLERADQVEQRLISWLYTMGCPLTNQEVALMETAKRIKANRLV